MVSHEVSVKFSPLKLSVLEDYNPCDRLRSAALCWTHTTALRMSLLSHNALITSVWAFAVRLVFCATFQDAVVLCIFTYNITETHQSFKSSRVFPRSLRSSWDFTHPYSGQHLNPSRRLFQLHIKVLFPWHRLFLTVLYKNLGSRERVQVDRAFEVKTGKECLSLMENSWFPELRPVMFLCFLIRSVSTWGTACLRRLMFRLITRFNVECASVVRRLNKCESQYLHDDRRRVITLAGNHRLCLN